MTPAVLETSLGEVIEASTAEFTAESARLNDPPAFGDFVRILPTGRAPNDDDPFDVPAPRDGTIYGLVMEARTASRESGRRAVSFGLEEEDLRGEQPQIWELLATDFVCLAVAHVDGGEVRAHLPPKPARLHAQVRMCPDSEVCLVTRGFGYLRTIASAPNCLSCDELMAASIRKAFQCHGRDEEFLVRAGRALAILLGDDYERLAAVLRKLY